MIKHDLTQRSIAVLTHIQAASGKGKHGIARSDVALKMELPRAVVSSIFTRLENSKLIERTTTEARTTTDQKLNYKVTSEGVEVIKRGSVRASDMLTTSKHSGVYAKAQVSTPSAFSTRNVMTMPVYTPPRNDPPRADANQHFNFKSKGST